MLHYEIAAEKKGYRKIAGVDEAGRGPLAGPVVAAAVILPLGESIQGVDDSKKLSPAKREELVPLIHKTALGWGIGIVEVETIDSINILQAARLAMKLAVEQLSTSADLLLIDGNQNIDSPAPQWTIVRGDSASASIASASILAKVERDDLMKDYHQRYPQYGFDQHKGYGTVLHRERIKDHGPCPIHRKTFKGVREFLKLGGFN